MASKKKSESLPNGAAWRAAELIGRLDRLARAGERSGDLNPAQWDALRYLARANRFSRTPAALAEFLGSTRGTVSQTIIALEAKGFVHKRASARDGRSVDLELTGAGRAALGGDSLAGLAEDLAAGTDASKLADALAAGLRAALARRGGKAFGVCRTCRHIRTDGKAAPFRCGLLDEPLSAADSELICVEQA
ncbi:MAG: MarR family transcriptional regulator [Tagaea sp.]|nr:MarR family transcriptional regulator [Tagaea sp.]